MALNEEEFRNSIIKIEELRKIISDLKILRDAVPTPVSNKLNDGIDDLESGLHKYLDLTYVEA